MKFCSSVAYRLAVFLPFKYKYRRAFGYINITSFDQHINYHQSFRLAANLLKHIRKMYGPNASLMTNGYPKRLQDDFRFSSLSNAKRSHDCLRQLWLLCIKSQMVSYNYSGTFNKCNASQLQSNRKKQPQHCAVTYEYKNQLLSAAQNYMFSSARDGLKAAQQ